MIPPGKYRVVLIGMMGSGKTTIGGLVSDALGWPYVDNDELIHRSLGVTPRQLLAERGEHAMRDAESAALALGMKTPAPAIIGAAAGTILDPANRDLLRGEPIVVWLRASVDVLEARAMGAEHRPWLDSGEKSWLRRAAVERDPLYASVADVTIDTDAGSAAESAAELVESLAAPSQF